MLGKNLHHEGPQNHLHGFISPYLARGNKSGYGIFATADRIVGVRSRRARALFLLGPAIAAFGGSLYLAQDLAFHEPLTTTRMFSLAIFTILGLVFLAVIRLRPLISSGISEADASRKADFVVRLTDVSKIEMTPNRTNIKLRSGEVFSLEISHWKVYEATTKMMTTFFPESLV